MANWEYLNIVILASYIQQFGLIQKGRRREAGKLIKKVMLGSSRQPGWGPGINSSVGIHLRSVWEVNKKSYEGE